MIERLYEVVEIGNSLVALGVHDVKGFTIYEPPIPAVDNFPCPPLMDSGSNELEYVNQLIEVCIHDKKLVLGGPEILAAVRWLDWRISIITLHNIQTHTFTFLASLLRLDEYLRVVSMHHENSFRFEKRPECKLVKKLITNYQSIEYRHLCYFSRIAALREVDGFMMKYRPGFYEKIILPNRRRSIPCYGNKILRFTIQDENFIPSLAIYTDPLLVMRILCDCFRYADEAEFVKYDLADITSFVKDFTRVFLRGMGKSNAQKISINIGMAKCLNSIAHLLYHAAQLPYERLVPDEVGRIGLSIYKYFVNRFVTAIKDFDNTHPEIIITAVYFTGFMDNFVSPWDETIHVFNETMNVLAFRALPYLEGDGLRMYKSKDALGIAIVDTYMHGLFYMQRKRIRWDSIAPEWKKHIQASLRLDCIHAILFQGFVYNFMLGLLDFEPNLLQDIKEFLVREIRYLHTVLMLPCKLDEFLLVADAICYQVGSMVTYGQVKHGEQPRNLRFHETQTAVINSSISA